MAKIKALNRVLRRIFKKTRPEQNETSPHNGDPTRRSRRRVFQGFRLSCLFKRKAKSSGCGENELREYNTCNSGSGDILPEHTRSDGSDISVSSLELFESILKRDKKLIDDYCKMRLAEISQPHDQDWEMTTSDYLISAVEPEITLKSMAKKCKKVTWEDECDVDIIPKMEMEIKVSKKGILLLNGPKKLNIQKKVTWEDQCEAIIKMEKHNTNEDKNTKHKEPSYHESHHEDDVIDHNEKANDYSNAMWQLFAIFVVFIILLLI